MAANLKHKQNPTRQMIYTCLETQKRTYFHVRYYVVLWQIALNYIFFYFESIFFFFICMRVCVSNNCKKATRKKIAHTHTHTDGTEFETISIYSTRCSHFAYCIAFHGSSSSSSNIRRYLLFITTKKNEFFVSFFFLRFFFTHIISK